MRDLGLKILFYRLSNIRTEKEWFMLNAKAYW